MTLFYLGTHRPHWLGVPDLPDGVALFVSHRTLGQRRSLPRARGPWVLDSGGFSELSMYGEWRTTPVAYLAAVRRYAEEMGGLAWAAPMDWMCEPVMLAKTGLNVTEHQRRTVDNLLRLRDMWGTGAPFAPVLQGWQRDDYLRCWDMYDRANVDLASESIVGLGSVCRRQAESEIGAIVTSLLCVDPRLSLHGFGVKLRGLLKYGHLLASADSMAWSYDARRSAALPGCIGHQSCANCLRYALRWRAKVLPMLVRPRTIYLHPTLFDLADLS